MNQLRKSEQVVALAADVAVFRVHNNEPQVLVGSASSDAFSGRNCLIGGLIGCGETADEAAARHLHEQAGIKRVYTEQVYTFSAVARDPDNRVASVAYMALTNTGQQSDTIGGEVQWVSVRKPGKLAYDHSRILKTTFSRLQAKIRYSNVAQHLLPKTFTLTELQRTYEAVLEQEVDKRNFRRKVLDEELVVSVGEKTTRNTKRPAELYRFANKQVQYIDLL
jgi:8-oxo-dGTP diphosphatase